MSVKPKCIIVTGRAGSGKTTFARKLADHVWMPVISRDAVKEGYVNTYGVKHDALPGDTNQIVTDYFFHLVSQYLAGNISVIVEAAFQHEVWASRLDKIAEIAELFIIICSVDKDTAAQRHLERGLKSPEREFYHGDKRVTHYRETGEVLPPADYETPKLEAPTVEVSTVGEYKPGIDEIIGFIR